MELYAYCFMPSHIHFIFRSSNEQPSELLRDFKRHTSKKVIEAIKKIQKKVEKNGYYGCLS
jgi:putative transposase